MKNIFITASLLFISIFSNAQGDAKAKAILDKVSANVKSLKSLKANFSITITGAKTKAQTKTETSTKVETSVKATTKPVLKTPPARVPIRIPIFLDTKDDETKPDRWSPSAIV